MVINNPRSLHMKVVYFSSADKFRKWLEDNHHTATELQVGFYKKKSGRSGMTYREAVEEALCFGWIDSVVHSIDEDRFRQRFSPRKTSSVWSNVNVAHVVRLTKAGKMHPTGLRAFEARKAEKTGIYSFEQKNSTALPVAYLKQFKANAKAWKFFSAQAPWYQRIITHRIISAKREATRLRRLERVIAASANHTIL